MNNTLTKSRGNDSIIDDYMISISTKCENMMSITKKQIKVNDETIIIPTILNYGLLCEYNYNLTQLKFIAKTHKLKNGGNKKQIQTRIYSHLYLSSFIIKIQKVFRGFLVKTYKKLHGPAAFNRELCTNTDDFITMEPIKEIGFHQFISYKDVDGFIYGFEIISLYKLLLKSKDIEVIRNPYNRSAISELVVKQLKSLIRISKIIKIHINIHYENDVSSISNEKMVELKALALFQNIDSLGNYSNPDWFLSLNRYQIINFIRNLFDIWSYRSQISIETKCNIYPPNGDPFRNVSMAYLHQEINIYNVKKSVLEVIDKFVNSGVDKDSRALGAYYVLGALTIVNDSAAASLPWLFHSFGNF
jgi:hypothetical protein